MKIECSTNWTKRALTVVYVWLQAVQLWWLFSQSYLYKSKSKFWLKVFENKTNRLWSHFYCNWWIASRCLSSTSYKHSKSQTVTFKILFCKSSYHSPHFMSSVEIWSNSKLVGFAPKFINSSWKVATNITISLHNDSKWLVLLTVGFTSGPDSNSQTRRWERSKSSSDLPKSLFPHRCLSKQAVKMELFTKADPDFGAKWMRYDHFVCRVGSVLWKVRIECFVVFTPL